jgi:hypothetical protein
MAERIRDDGGFELEADARIERRSWRLQRTAWLLAIFILIAAVVGLFGNGPLSNLQLQNSDGTLQLHLKRFTHTESPTRLTIRARTFENQEHLRLWVSQPFLSAMHIEHIAPVPDVQTADADRTIFDFHIVASHAHDVVIEFDLEPNEIGWQRGRAGIVDAAGNEIPSATIEFSQLCYP